MPLKTTPSIDATFEPKDGHTIATEEEIIICPAAGNYSITFTISRLRYVHRVLEIQRNTNPLTNSGTPSLTHISGNVVGVTLIGVGAGTTITALCTAIGV